MQINETAENVYFSIRKVAVAGKSSAIGENLKELAALSGCSVLPDINIADLMDNFGSFPEFDLLITEFTSNSDRQSDEISVLARYLITSGVEAIIWTDMDNLEEAYSNLPTSQCHFLSDGCEREALLIMSGYMARSRKMDQLHDTSREGGFEHLHRISDELADFARALARMAESDNLGGTEKQGNRVADKPVSFRPAPANINHPFVENEPASAVAARTGVEAKFIREIIKMRRRRDTFFEPEMFADPAWDILLDLLAARLEGKSVSVSSLCIAAAVPATTALRWISSMTENGILVRRQDPTDARRIFIDLSQVDAEKLMDFFAEVNRTKSTFV